MQLFGKDIEAEFLPPVASSLHPQTMVMAFKVKYDSKTLYVGCGIGYGDRVSEIGQLVANAIGKPSNGTLHIVSCLHADTAQQRAQHSLIVAEHGDAVFIQCKNSNIIDAVLISQWIGLSSKSIKENLEEANVVSMLQYDIPETKH